MTIKLCLDVIDLYIKAAQDKIDEYHKESQGLFDDDEGPPEPVYAFHMKEIATRIKREIEWKYGDINNGSGI
jgi:hypothetical protein